MPTPEEMKAAQEAEAQAQAAAAAAAQSSNGTEDVASLKAQLEKERNERKSANAEAQKFRKLVRETEDAKKKAEEAILAEKGQHKELAERLARELEAQKLELEPLREFKTAAERAQSEQLAQEAAQVEADFAALPEAARAHIPADADLRLKKIVIQTARAAAGTKVHTPPTPTAPRPASGSTSAPPEPTDVEVMALGDPRTPMKEKREIQQKIDAWNAWQRSR